MEVTKFYRSRIAESNKVVMTSESLEIVSGILTWTLDLTFSEQLVLGTLAAGESVRFVRVKGEPPALDSPGLV